MKGEKELNPAKSFISPPGDTLKEHLDFIGMPESKLAEKMNVSEEKLHGVICGKEPVTAEMASRLERVLNIPAAFCENREKTYRQEISECGAGG